MIVSRRRVLGIAVAWLSGNNPAFAQAPTVRLAEENPVGSCLRYDIILSLTGKMKVERNGKTEAMVLEAKGRLQFAERVEKTAARGAVGKVVRLYSDATSEAITGVDRVKRMLGADRRIIVAQRTAGGTRNFSPAGPLTRDELNLVAEQFDTLGLPSLLPGKDVALGDTWPIDNTAAQAACQFDVLVKHDLVGKLLNVNDGMATIAIDGTAEGVEHGANVKLTIAARGTFDTTAKRLTALTWDQTDLREQGPVSPAIEAKATIAITRTVVPAPAELAAVTAEKLPPDGKVPELLLHLRHADAAYELVYPRDWHTVVQSDKHLVLRLLLQGELIGQATITEWKNADAGTTRETLVREFADAIAKQPGWDAEKALASGAVATGPGRQLYRSSFLGKQDGLPVLQSFYLLTASDGRQLVVACQVRQEAAGKIEQRDVALVNAIEFRPGK